MDGLKIWQRIQLYGRMVKFSHTIFALPFACSAVLLAWREHPVDVSDLFWILLALFAARSAAMGFNRVVDARYDAENPRTANREIPSGKLQKSTAAAFVACFSLLFIWAAAMLSRLCLVLSVPVLILLLSYSYTKRCTWLCHLYLGFVISLAPMGAWIALTGEWSWRISVLSLALMSYIAGFDILYACQDIQFDRRKGLFSLPACLGAAKSLVIARAIHLLSFFSLLLIKPLFGLGSVYTATVFIIGFLFWLEHRMVKPDDLSRVNIAFFHINSMISVILFIGLLIDELVRW